MWLLPRIYDTWLLVVAIFLVSVFLLSFSKIQLPPLLPKGVRFWGYRISMTANNVRIFGDDGPPTGIWRSKFLLLPSPTKTCYHIPKFSKLLSSTDPENLAYKFWRVFEISSGKCHLWGNQSGQLSLWGICLPRMHWLKGSSWQQGDSDSAWVNTV